MTGEAPAERRVEAIEVLARTPQAVRALIEGASAEAIETAADDSWSPHDVVAHLLITQRIGALDRIRSIVTQENPFLLNRDEIEELRLSGFASKQVGELLDEFESRRAEDIEWLRSLEASAFERAGQHSVAGRVTAEEMLFHAAHHDLTHVDQIARMIAARFEPYRGGMRVF